MKKLVLTLALLCAGYSFAQIPPLNVVIGQRWPLGQAAVWYGGLRATVPIGVRILGQDLYALPEGGISQETLEPYGRLQFVVDGSYATLAADARVTPTQQYLALEVRFGF